MQIARESIVAQGITPAGIGLKDFESYIRNLNPLAFNPLARSA